MLYAAFGPAMAAGSDFQVEARYRRSDGIFRVLRTMALPRLDSAGGFIGMIGVNEDVTEQREAEQALLAQSRVGLGVFIPSGMKPSFLLPAEVTVPRLCNRQFYEFASQKAEQNSS